MEPGFIGAFQVSIFEGVATSVLAASMVGMFAMLRSFIKEQRRANAATSKANRSMQRDVLYRYFRIIVEEGKPVTPEEWSHVQECYEAYHANGGNGTGTLMFRKMEDSVVIDTGRR